MTASWIVCWIDVWEKAVPCFAVCLWLRCDCLIESTTQSIYPSQLEAAIQNIFESVPCVRNRTSNLFCILHTMHPFTRPFCRGKRLWGLLLGITKQKQSRRCWNPASTRTSKTCVVLLSGIHKRYQTIFLFSPPALILLLRCASMEVALLAPPYGSLSEN